MKDGNDLYERLGKNWLVVLMITMFIVVVLIFMSVIPVNANQTWLDYAIDFVINYWDGTLFSSLVLFGIFIWAIMYITKSPSSKNGKD